MKQVSQVFLSLLIISFLYACGNGKAEKERRDFKPIESMKPLTYEEAVADWKNQKGLGPVKSVELGEFNEEMAKKGAEIYELKCTACHNPDDEKVGPPPINILSRRTPEWIMNMILNPEEMAIKDPIARGLLVQYNTVMANQGLTQEDARAVLEYFRTLK